MFNFFKNSENDNSPTVEDIQKAVNPIIENNSKIHKIQFFICYIGTRPVLKCMVDANPVLVEIDRDSLNTFVSFYNQFEIYQKDQVEKAKIESLTEPQKKTENLLKTEKKQEITPPKSN